MLGPYMEFGHIMDSVTLTVLTIYLSDWQTSWLTHTTLRMIKLSHEQTPSDSIDTAARSLVSAAWSCRKTLGLLLLCSLEAHSQYSRTHSRETKHLQSSLLRKPWKQIGFKRQSPQHLSVVLPSHPLCASAATTWNILEIPKKCILKADCPLYEGRVFP